MQRAILLVGSPGAGKGTFAKQMKEFGYKIICVGDECRLLSKEDSPLGEQVRKQTSSGGFVSDETVFQIIEERLKQYEEQNIILDGAPRNTYQMTYLLNLLKKRGYEICLFEIYVSKELARERLSLRGECRACGENFTSKDDICPVCGCTEIKRRKDDVDPVARELRLKKYDTETFPLVKIAQEEGIHIAVEGRLGEEGELQKAIKILDEFFSSDEPKLLQRGDFSEEEMVADACK
jgi:adenylate kinase